MNLLSIKSVKGKIVLLTTILAGSFSFLSITSVNIAIPAMQDFFQVSLSQIQWAVNVYAIMLAVFILAGGYLGDHFGRKKVFLYGIIIFLFGSAASALSGNINHLIFFQVVQGMGAAIIIPGSLAIINALFKEEEKGKAIGFWVGLTGGFVVFGPLLGGWIIDALGWQFIFWLNIPVCVVAWILAKNNIEESFNTEIKKMDIVGALLLIVIFLGFTISIIKGPQFGWNNLLIIFQLQPNKQ